MPVAQLPRSTRGPVGVRHIGRPLRTEVLSRPYQNDLTLGTAGQVITSANSAGQATGRYDDVIDAFGGGLAYDTTHLHSSSSMAALLAMANGQTASQNMRFTNLRITPNTQVVTRVYFWIDAAPTQGIQIVRYEGSDGVAIGGVRLTNGGTMVAWRASNASVGSVSAVLPLSQWIRVEIAIRAQTNIAANTGYLEIRAWWTNPESTGTPDYTDLQNPLTAGLGGNEVIDRVMFGSGNSVTALTAAWNIWFAQPATNYTDWVGPAPVFAGGPTTNFLTLTAASTPTSLLANQAAKPIAASEAAAALAARQTGKLVFISETAAALVTRQAAKILPASETAAAATSRQAGKTLPLSETASTLLQRRAGKLLAASETATALVMRQTAKQFVVSETASVLAPRRAGKQAAALETATAVLGRIKVALLLLTASSTATATVQKQAGKVVAASETATAGIQRRTAKALAGASVPTVTIRSLVGKVLAVAESATATLARIKSVQMLLSATSTAATTIQRRTGKSLATSEAAVVAAARRTSRALGATSTAAVTVAKRTAKTAVAVETAAATVASLLISVVTRRTIALYGYVMGIGDRGQPQSGDIGIPTVGDQGKTSTGMTGHPPAGDSGQVNL